VNPGMIAQIFPPAWYLLKKKQIFGTFSCVHNRTPREKNFWPFFKKLPQLQNEKKTSFFFDRQNTLFHLPFFNSCLTGREMFCFLAFLPVICELS
jgi:hypothetical protein